MYSRQAICSVKAFLKSLQCCVDAANKQLSGLFIEATTSLEFKERKRIGCALYKFNIKGLLWMITRGGRGQVVGLALGVHGHLLTFAHNNSPFYLHLLFFCSCLFVLSINLRFHAQLLTSIIIHVGVFPFLFQIVM